MNTPKSTNKHLIEFSTTELEGIVGNYKSSSHRKLGLKAYITKNLDLDESVSSMPSVPRQSHHNFNPSLFFKKVH
jgi:hypothetical protein